ncbi:hypothetical protein L596_003606 [Steinernema carpocapsae]|uniref:Thioredoxin domain-containing protein n=1 Tax=Steinernema carpocapsae TaxID=34508 RepID=A0A4U8UWB4_STECR|nr:hypothetical protein L596_003606 [Steinernema carpocapsae]
MLHLVSASVHICIPVASFLFLLPTFLTLLTVYFQMKAFLGLLLLVSFAAVQSEKKETNPHAHGFGDEVEWVQWDNAISIAMDLNKPILLLVHKTWCGACKALKTTFRVSTNRGELIKLSDKFVMTNTEDDEEPEDEEYAPDGRYIPRIFFLDKFGKRLEVNNKKAYPNNQYYYPQINDIVKGMKKALELFEAPADKEDEKEVEEKKEEKEEEEKKAECPHAKAAREKKEKAKKEKKKQTEKTEKSKEDEDKKENKKESKKDSKDAKKTEKETKESKKETKKNDKKKETKKVDKEEKNTSQKSSEKSKSEKKDSKSKDANKSDKKEKAKKSAKTEL